MTNINDLSDREREILFLVATGVSNKEIASSLYISTNTVKVHLRNIFAKIGVTTRTEAAMYAVSAGLVEPGMNTRSGHLEGLPGLVTTGGMIDVPTGNITQRLRSRWLTVGAVAALIVLGIIALFGWRTARSLNRASVSLSPTAIPPRWEERTPLRMARKGLAVAVYGNQIYAIAGETSEGVTGVLERYDPATDRWSSLLPKPVPVADVSAAVIGGKFYIPGGRLASGEVTNLMEIYDPLQDTWEKGSPLPVALSAYALAAFEGKLYLFGGWNGGKILASVYEYDPEGDVWTPRTPMPTARAFAGAALAGGNIFVVGGYDGQRALAVNEIYLPERDDGQQVAWTQGEPLPEGRYAMGVASVADILHVIGGVGNKNVALQSLEYPPQTGVWQAFESPHSQPWSQLGVAAFGTRLFVVGGELNTAPTAKNLAYQAIYIITLPVVR
jgi:DNA-binding CsgD family transcriptional regulator